jgi:hypothetical protein
MFFVFTPSLTAQAALSVAAGLTPCARMTMITTMTNAAP